MTVTVLAVHPTVVIVKAADHQFELPLESFSTRPKPGQAWKLMLDHEPTEEERIASLNDLLPRA